MYSRGVGRGHFPSYTSTRIIHFLQDVSESNQSGFSYKISRQIHPAVLTTYIPAECYRLLSIVLLHIHIVFIVTLM